LVGLVFVLINSTGVMIQNFVYTIYSQTNSGPFSLAPSSSYVSTTFGGFQGNCLFGIFNIKLSGANSITDKRGPTFSKTSPLGNFSNNKRTNDQFSITYNALCFTGKTCASPLLYSFPTQTCIVCPVANCNICLTITICKKCNTNYGW
jgi:hypothetical protein